MNRLRAAVFGLSLLLTLSTTAAAETLTPPLPPSLPMAGYEVVIESLGATPAAVIQRLSEINGSTTQEAALVVASVPLMIKRSTTFLDAFNFTTVLQGAGARVTYGTTAYGPPPIPGEPRFDILISQPDISKRNQVVTAVQTLTRTSAKEANNLLFGSTGPVVVRANVAHEEAAAVVFALEGQAARVSVQPAFTIQPTTTTLTPTKPGTMTTAPTLTAPTERLYHVVLSAIGAKRVQVIRLVQENTSLGLAPARTLVDESPNYVGVALSKERAAALRDRLAEQGATSSIL